MVCTRHLPHKIMDLLVSAKGCSCNLNRKVSAFFPRRNQMGTDQSRARLDLLETGVKKGIDLKRPEIKNG